MKSLKRKIIMYQLNLIGEVKNVETKNVLTETLGWKNSYKTMGFYRRSLNLTKLKLAKSLGVAPSLVWYWEQGIKDPTTTNLMKLARALGVTETELLHPSDEVKEKMKEMGIILDEP